MKKYISFFRIRFAMGLQYRVAAFAGVICQFFWGFMSIMIYHAFYRSDTNAFPMTMDACASYIWLQQAFLALFMAWMMETEIFDSIVNGNIAYELCRPLDIYNMWYSRSVANRLSKAILRCFPILLVAGFLPKGYRMNLPVNFPTFLLSLLTLVLALLVTVSLCMLVYVLTFFTISQVGLRIFFLSIVEFFAGAVLPIPFFPQWLQNIMNILPFASMQNVPLRVYSGDISGKPMWNAIMIQVIWLIILTVVGKLLCKIAVRKVTIQGG